MVLAPPHALATVVGDLDTAVMVADRACHCGQLANHLRCIDSWLRLFAGRPEALAQP